MYHLLEHAENSIFCPQSVFMILGKKPITAPNSINPLIIVMEKCFFKVRAEFLNTKKHNVLVLRASVIAALKRV